VSAHRGDVETSVPADRPKTKRIPLGRRTTTGLAAMVPVPNRCTAGGTQAARRECPVAVGCRVERFARPRARREPSLPSVDCLTSEAARIERTLNGAVTGPWVADRLLIRLVDAECDGGC